MDKSGYLNKLHEEILVIMDEIDRICVENNIKYYLVGGSLLGAVRHEGFIPWDDDLDIAMPRSDFERFINILPSCCGSKFYLEWMTTDSDYWHPFAKICRSDTLFQESLYHDINTSWGIFVDIFVLDTADNNFQKLRYKKKLVNLCSKLIKARLDSPKDNGLKRKFKLLFKKWIHNSFLDKLRSKLMTSQSEGRYYINYGSQYSVEKQTILKEDYGNAIYLKFENKCYAAPANYKVVLEAIYGTSYMTVPPPEKRRIHYPSMVRFSDGDVIEFDHKDVDKVSVD